MGGKLLYILGAGASSQALPLGEKLADRLLEFSEELTIFKPFNNELNSTENNLLWGNVREKFIKSLQWLGIESKRHVSVDTYAKKLFFKGDISNLNKLKAVLSTYLTIEQSIKPTDKRYDAFFATILKSNSQNKISLPEDLRILTWNYDTQLEKSFYEFCEDDKHVADSITFKENQTYRVNGYCGTPRPGRLGDAFRSVWQAKDPESAWSAGLRLFMGYEHDTNEPDINFAWEEKTKNRIANNNSDWETIATCVIIGYSFPYFNREIDDNIWLNLSNVRKIYLQYPNGHHASVINRVKSIFHPIIEPEIIQIPSSDKEFYLPEEFWKL